MKKVIFLLFALFLLIGCSKNDPLVDGLWKEAETFRLQDNLDSSIGSLNEIITNYPQHKKAADAQFMIGEIYLNDVKNYNIALDEFRKVIGKFPKSDMAEKALFMEGYINVNYLQAYTDGIESYHAFLEKYPNSELVAAVQYELDSLEDVEKQISELNNMVTSASEAN